MVNGPAAPSLESPASAQRPPDEFSAMVKDALAHMLDLGYLHRHPLSLHLGLDCATSRMIVGQRLRQALVDATEVLLPENCGSVQSSAARSYHITRLHYLQGMTVDMAAQEMSVSRRQAYRDLRRGEEAVAEVLWARRRCSRSTAASATHISSVEAEIAQLGPHARPTDLCDLLREAGNAVESIAVERHICLQLRLPRRPIIVSADPVLARQVMVSLMSRTVQQAQPGLVSVELIGGPRGSRVTLCCHIPANYTGSGVVDPIAAQLMDQLSWVAQMERGEGLLCTIVRTANSGPTVLVIDDNVGLVRLLERYLTHQACRVVTAADGREGLRLAQQLVPDAILLDVMMPEMDGWALLQRLRNHPKTASVPVVICSVINDEALAYSLGASLVLHKPVSRASVLDALHQVGAV